MTILWESSNSKRPLRIVMLGSQSYTVQAMNNGEPEDLHGVDSYTGAIVYVLQNFPEAMGR